MKEIMLASANAHKAQEFEEMLRPLGYTVKTLLDLKAVSYTHLDVYKRQW